MTKRLLIVSPNFPPQTTADLHRVRVSLPYYRSFGWEPTILSVDATCCEGINDPALLRTLPDDIKVVRVKAWPLGICRRLGFSLLDYRALVPLYFAGNKLLCSERFDVVFFSTTAFLTFVLGRIWRQRFGCRIVYDFQDPWYQGNAPPYNQTNAPGGWRKYRMSQAVARRGEAFAMRAADHIISVSQSYVADLSERYAFLRPDMFSIIPFGASSRDYEYLNWSKTAPPFSNGMPQTKWVSVGRAGVDMHEILAVFFRALAQLKRISPEFTRTLKVEFVGTNYAPLSRSVKLVEPIAAQFDLSDIVKEKSERVPYFEALSLYRQSDGILIFGTNDANYTPSKFFPCLLAHKPILAMCHAGSLISQIAQSFGSVSMATFRKSPDEQEFFNAVDQGIEWLRHPKFNVTDIDRQCTKWSAKVLTKEQCEIFNMLSVPVNE